MNYRKTTRRARLGITFGALAIALGTLSAAQPADAQNRTYRPTGQVVLSTGEGQMITVSRPVADVWISNPDVADVYVTNSRQLNLFGKKNGEATVIATAANGSVVYATNVRVSQNLSNVNEVLHAAMPDSNITVTTVGQLAVMNGTVASPEDAAQAQALVTSLLNPGKKEGDQLDIMPVNRLKTATPLQVTLKVRVAEVNRTLLKSIGVNLIGRDTNPGGIFFGIGQGDPGALNGGSAAGDREFHFPSTGTGLGLAGKLLGVDLLGTLDLAATDGMATILAEPNLTALSGETASFLAGGEFPIILSQSIGSNTIEYKSYGVSLAFTPVVLADGRISMRVRPEVSELTNEGAVKLGDFTVPALVTRRAETTVELGSGQSFMIAGLLKNTNANSLSKAPFLGDLPILGALFRSTSFKRSETELVIIVTPYLVRPVSTQLATPVDGYRAPGDVQQWIGGQTFTGTTGGRIPQAVPAGPVPAGSVAAPGFKL
jgi:pilus assembly protein CpaC